MIMRKKYAILVAAGKGTRMQASIPKQFLQLQGRPMLFYTIQAFLNAYADIHIILVVPERKTALASSVLDYFGKEATISITNGGPSRFDSVKNGLRLTASSDAVIFVHDGARPLVSPELIKACYEQALERGSAIPALPLKDSIRQVGEKGSIALDRNLFRVIQTPQTFLSELLIPAFEQPYRKEFTDEATVVEYAGKAVCLIKGEEENIKITRPIDMLLATQVLLKRSKG